MENTKANRWATLLHLSVLAGYLVPLAGFVAPIVIWQVKKDEFPELDTHGRIVLNWIISETIYIGIACLLTFLLVGLPLLVALSVLAIAFPLIGGLKANRGEVWIYPLSIQFFKLRR